MGRVRAAVMIASSLFASSLFALGLSATSGAAPPGQSAQPDGPANVLKSIKSSGSMWLASGPRDGVELGADRTLAPYFYVAGGDPQTERLPLAQTRADVDIAGVIARVVVHQVFKNSGSRPIEAVYVFPASTRAAVHAMRMRIGQRTVEARIERRQEARAQYEAAKQQGRRASLLEQERPNVFTTSVANIMPGDRIEVELEYTELIVPEEGVYELVYPAVVGPRYAGGADAAKDRWMANPHLQQGEKEPYGFDVKVHLQTGIPIKDLTSPSHKVAIAWEGPAAAVVRLDQAGGGNKDFVLRYRLAGDRIESGVLTYEQPGREGRSGERFFALMMEPPRRPATSDIPPREYVFLLDVSGSMHGFPLDTAKALMRDLLGHLRPTDHFNVALFSGANYVWSPSGSRQATAANVEQALAVIEGQQGGGGTELMGGLEGAYAIPPLGRGVSRTVVVVTDGYVGVEAQAFRFIRERLDQANLFAFGIGSSVNRALIEGMARAGMGAPFVVLRPEKAAAEADKLRRMIDRPVLTDIQVRWRGVDVYDVAPEKVPDLMAERPLLLFGKLRSERPGTVEISGRTGRGTFSRSIEIRPADARPQNAPLRALWARKWVEILEDELALAGGTEVESAVTNLGLGYGLLTPFTSFVAIDSEVVNRSGQTDSVRQPLPMPEGVSNLAVGGAAPSSKSAGVPSPSPATTSMASRRPALPPTGQPGQGYGAVAPAAPVAVSPAPAPEPVAAAPAAELDRAAPERGAAKKEDKRPAPLSCSVSARIRAASSLNDAGALGPFIEQVVRTGVCPAPGSMTLRLTIDASGRITRVERVSGDVAAVTAVTRKLHNRVTPARAAAAPVTVEVTIAVAS